MWSSTLTSLACQACSAELTSSQYFTMARQELEGRSAFSLLARRRSKVWEGDPPQPCPGGLNSMLLFRAGSCRGS